MSGPDDTHRLLTEIRDLLREVASTQKIEADRRTRAVHRAQRTMLFALVLLAVCFAYTIWWYARYGSVRHS